MNYKKIIIIAGPTATGKTQLGVEIADKFNGEIISVDSRQVYKHLNIGTGKDLCYFTNKSIKYHLIDIIPPNDINNRYNVQRFCNDARKKIIEIYSKNKIPILVGGSLMYLNAFICNYSFDSCEPNYTFRNAMANKNINYIIQYAKEKYNIKNIFVDSINNKHRIIRSIEKQIYKKNISKNEYKNDLKYEFLFISPYFNRNELYQRIKNRLYDRIKNGLINEVRNLHKYHKIDWSILSSFGLEYKYVVRYLISEISLTEMIRRLLKDIKKFARTQELWLKNISHNGININLTIEKDYFKIYNLIDKFINDNLNELESIFVNKNNILNDNCKKEFLNYHTYSI